MESKLKLEEEIHRLEDIELKVLEIFKHSS